MMKGTRISLLLTFYFGFVAMPAYSTVVPVLPYPQFVSQGKDALAFSSVDLVFVSLDKQAANRLADHWRTFAGSVRKGKTSKITIGLLGQNKGFDASVSRLASEKISSIGQEGYVLLLSNKQNIIAANSEAGLFYGIQSLKQLIRAGWNKEISIIDWPAFPNRIIYDDISRGPISTVDYIKQQIERMAEIKLNGLSFYIEHVVQPGSYPDFAPQDGKLTIPQIKELSAYAAKHHMQLVGSFQSFGHFEKILSLPQYRYMGETSTLISPLEPGAKQFLGSVIGELCDAFESPYFNVNCDETFDLTKGKSKKYIDSVGAARFYADHLQFLYDVVKRHNKKLMMWGDVALQNEEILDLLPKDVIYLTWEYGNKKSYDQWILPFKKRGLNYMVCPGILNSYRMFPDMTMARGNIRSFIDDAVKHEAKGVLTTIWDDGGACLFSGDWYGVYVSADKSWNTSSGPEVSFDNRYEMVAYGMKGGAYVKALNQLMELRALPITYNLNDQIWHQKMLPDSGQLLIINNSSAKAALKIISEADKLLRTAAAKRNKPDIEALRFAIDQYNLIIQSRILLAGVANQYKKVLEIAGTNPGQAKNILLQVSAAVRKAKDNFLQLRQRFQTAWLRENQPYWLDVVLEGYDKKIGDLNQLANHLHAISLNLKDPSGLPAAAQIRLAIKESQDYFFQNWLLAGPFPFSTQEQLPEFLYSATAEYNKPPIPGGFTQYRDKTYRWQKFASQEGGVIDLDDNFHQPLNALSYAYCTITVERAMIVDAFFSSDNGAEIFCNDEKVYSHSETGSAGTEGQMRLSLTEGVNHVLLKLPKKEGTPWAFTFRLGKNFSVTNHKHKYQLNPQKNTYEAD